MTDARQALGQRGEELAVTELIRRGYAIRTRNWRCRAGEIDIVAEHAGWLVFVEVRTRRGRAMGSPEMSITPTKQARLIQVAQSYLAEFEPQALDWRIDVVAIELSPGGKLLRIDVYENAVRG
jgi:putative endonuclease